MKSGIVVLAGRSNVGKSTLLNALVGTKVAITSPKPQTTRASIRGILNDPRGQIVFVDSPGILESAHDPLTRAVNESARAALSGVDVIVYVVNPTRAIGTEEHRIHALLRNSTAKKILVRNKADLPERERPYLDAYHDLVFGGSPTTTENSRFQISDSANASFIAEVDVSALKGQHLARLVDLLYDALPEGEPLYEEGRIADIPQKQWIAELIREKVFLVMHQEVPYTVTVEVDEVATRENGDLFIAARILTTNDRYRRMLIGAGAQRVKQIGQMVRRELELATSKRAYVELHVVTDPKWKDRL